MRGLSFRAIPCKGTWLTVFVFLGWLLWVFTFRASFGLFLLSGFTILLALCFALGSLVWALISRTRSNWCRATLWVSALVLILPTAWVGNWLNGEFFLISLPYYQELSDSILSKTKLAPSPPALNLATLRFAFVGKDKSGAPSVWFVQPDSSAVGHQGYVYQPDDNLEVLQQTKPDCGFAKVAPKWYAFGD